MKHLKLLVLGLILSNLSFGQIIKVQTGATFSNLDWKIGSLDLEPFNETLIGYSVFTGVDYFDKKFFNLSSNLGVVQKGGKGTITFTTATGEPIEEKNEKAELGYFTVNTTLDIKYPIKDKITPFISVGPRFDYLASYSKVFNGLNEIDELKKYSIGLILGGGIKYDLSKIQIGLRADYYLNFEKVADWPLQTENLGGEINDRTITLNLTIGYRL
ncbi:MAG: outer membrane beta-barrel protein [Tenuifilaceae bacterium]|jgi:hypothetical protein|nr:outer membrane beta-barrel protein [Tenuifilaceae bacterium]